MGGAAGDARVWVAAQNRVLLYRVIRSEWTVVGNVEAEMDSVKTYQKRLRDGTAAVENEINARTQQIEGLTKRLEGLKRALELFRSDQAAITELLREPQSGFEMEIPDNTQGSIREWRSSGGD